MSWVVKINWLCLFVGIPYLVSMVIYPSTQGGWEHVHAVWYTWQSLNTGILAFIASIFALNAVRYTEEKSDRETSLQQGLFFLKLSPN
ncbi:hypothetical protein [Vibrio parahaemolyticus]|uniref:hypothetical protein n=1 Tax=Vibrio parahaemolyticus TaxID=670 RepID=UPI002109E9B3|nr:hypothetical protein [Vibrio parahaemolyticus]